VVPASDCNIDTRGLGAIEAESVGSRYADGEEGALRVVRGVDWADRVKFRVGSEELCSRAPCGKSIESWIESTGDISPIEPCESRANSSPKTLVLEVLAEPRLRWFRVELNDPSLETDCGAIGAVHPSTLTEEP
jgi:hypothetical protein